MFKRLIASIICITFILSNFQYAHAQDFSVDQLPVPGTMVEMSAPFAPLALKGLIVNPQKPLEFQFIVDTGRGRQDTSSVKEQANQLVKYFLAGLTIPEGDLWVNLSPYEKNRIVPEVLGQTDLGRDLLAQDYILKQLTASLIYPEKDLGKEFWSRVYAKAQAQFGTTNIPVNTFNKVWILPNEAQVYENGNAAYVTKSTLKVMLDEDYLAFQKNTSLRGAEGDEAISARTTSDSHSLGSQIVREIVLPEIEKEVNTGKNFAPLRQIYQALILSKWYKETIQNGLLDAIYTNKNKVAGVNLNDPTVKEQIYNRYLQAYKKGAFNYIKEDPIPDGQVAPRKYFSGGLIWKMDLNRTQSPAMLSKSLAAVAGALFLFTVSLTNANAQGKNSPQILATQVRPVLAVNFGGDRNTDAQAIKKLAFLDTILAIAVMGNLISGQYKSKNRNSSDSAMLNEIFNNPAFELIAGLFLIGAYHSVKNHFGRRIIAQEGERLQEEINEKLNREASEFVSGNDILKARGYELVYGDFNVRLEIRPEQEMDEGDGSTEPVWVTVNREYLIFSKPDKAMIFSLRFGKKRTATSLSTPESLAAAPGVAYQYMMESVVPKEQYFHNAKVMNFISQIDNLSSIDDRIRVYKDLLKMVIREYNSGNAFTGIPFDNILNIVMGKLYTITGNDEERFLRLFQDDSELREQMQELLHKATDYLRRVSRVWSYQEFANGASAFEAGARILAAHSFVVVSSEDGFERVNMALVDHLAANNEDKAKIYSNYYYRKISGYWDPDNEGSIPLLLLRKLKDMMSGDDFYKLLQPLINDHDHDIREKAYQLLTEFKVTPEQRVVLFEGAVKRSDHRGSEAEALRQMAKLPQGRSEAIHIAEGIVQRHIETRDKFFRGLPMDAENNILRAAAVDVLRDARSYDAYVTVVQKGSPVDVLYALKDMSDILDRKQMFAVLEKALEATNENDLINKIVDERLNITSKEEVGRVAVVLLKFLSHQELLSRFDGFGFTPNAYFAISLREAISKGDIQLSESLLEYLKKKFLILPFHAFDSRIESNLIEILNQHYSPDELFDQYKVGLMAAYDQDRMYFYLEQLKRTKREAETEPIILDKLKDAFEFRYYAWESANLLRAMARSGIKVKDPRLIYQIRILRLQSNKFVDSKLVESRVYNEQPARILLGEPDQAMFTEMRIRAWVNTGESLANIMKMLNDPDKKVREVPMKVISQLAFSRLQDQVKWGNRLKKRGGLGKFGLIDKRLMGKIESGDLYIKNKLSPIFEKALDSDYGDVRLWAIGGIKKIPGAQYKIKKRALGSEHPDVRIWASRISDPNNAMLGQMPRTNDYGGVDLNQIKVNRTGKIINVQFDQAQLDELMQGDFEGFSPVIVSIMPIQNPLSLFGIR